MKPCKFIFVFVISIFTNANAENGETFLIYGGTPAKEGQFPFQALFIVKNWLCSAIVLNENYALTAAHCARKGTSKDYRLYFGILKQGDIKNATMRNVIETTVHEQFEPATVGNDIALLKLDKPLEFSNVIQPVKLPSPEEDFTGQRVTVSGWGRTESGKGSKELLFIEQQIMDRNICEELMAKFKPPIQFKKGVVCATSHDGKRRSACPGDSGGPIVLKDMPILVGIVSFGPKDEICGNSVDYNARVSHYVDWIKAHT